ncbi:MAG TPA: MMPL family transporter [Marmoricola sp.]|nr:MMPL family transporter [Marmoricola sp.]
MFSRIAHLAVTAPKRILTVAGIFLVVGVILGAPVASHLKSGGFTVSNAESTAASNLLEAKFDGGSPNLIIQVKSSGGASSASAKAAATQVTSYLASQARTTTNPNGFLGGLTSYWASPKAASALESKDHKAGLIVAHIFGNDTQTQTRAGTIVDHLKTLDYGSATVTLGGSSVAYHQVNTVTPTDLSRAEMISIPLTAIALIFVFGSLIASLLPIAVGISAIIGTMAILRILASVTDVSIYALNMTTALGLALAIDYSLFMVSRYREELRKGVVGEEAILNTVRTAGRTVLFSSLTVALALAALAVFPMYFLRSFAYAGLAVVGLAATASLIVLPAILALVGPRINALDVRAFIRRSLKRPEPTPKPEREGTWYRLASVVMRRPVLLGGAVVAILLLLGSPFLRASYGYPDDRVLPASQSARAVGDDLRANYALNAGSALSGVLDQNASRADVNAYALRISKIGGVDGVIASSGVYRAGKVVGPAPTSYAMNGAQRFDVSSNVDPFSSQGKALVDHLRAAPAPWHVLWTGWAAFNVDAMSALANTLPLALGLIALSTWIVLFLFTGSIVIPFKALVLNMLSLSATFGAMVWVFQDGHLSSIIGFTSSGYLVANMVVLMFCMAFGMSMDYEVFLLSRIREEWVHSDQSHEANTEAVALGLARTGRIVTAAAVLMAIVFAAIVTSTVEFMQLFGLGLTLAVLTDATLVRGILVPSFMRLMGRANWYAPKLLRRLHDRIGLKEA